MTDATTRYATTRYAILRREETGLVLPVRRLDDPAMARCWVRYLNGLSRSAGSTDTYELAPAGS